MGSTKARSDENVARRAAARRARAPARVPLPPQPTLLNRILSVHLRQQAACKSGGLRTKFRYTASGLTACDEKRCRGLFVAQMCLPTTASVFLCRHSYLANLISLCSQLTKKNNFMNLQKFAPMPCVAFLPRQKNLCIFCKKDWCCGTTRTIILPAQLFFNQNLYGSSQ